MIQLRKKVFTITSVKYDQCIIYSRGNPVAIFNDGYLLRQEFYRKRSRAGFMLCTKDGKIKEVAFCYYFVYSEDKPQWEYDSVEIKKLVDKGIPLLQAADIVLNRRKKENNE